MRTLRQLNRMKGSSQQRCRVWPLFASAPHRARCDILCESSLVGGDVIFLHGLSEWSRSALIGWTQTQGLPLLANALQVRLVRKRAEQPLVGMRGMVA